MDGRPGLLASIPTDWGFPWGHWFLCTINRSLQNVEALGAKKKKRESERERERKIGWLVLRQDTVIMRLVLVLRNCPPQQRLKSEVDRGVDLRYQGYLSLYSCWRIWWCRIGKGLSLRWGKLTFILWQREWEVMEKNKLMPVPLRETQGEKSKSRQSNNTLFYN